MEISDYYGLISGAKADKLAATGVTATKGNHVNAPTLDQYPLSIECEVIDTKEIGPHLMIIGEIKGILAEESVLDEKGSISVEKLAPIGLDPVGLNYMAFDKIIGKAYQAGKSYLNK